MGPTVAKSFRKPNLDDVARALHRQLKNDENVSFVEKDRKSDAIVQIKFDVVKHIIEVRVAENDAAMLARTNAEKRQQILEVLAKKENSELETKTPQELKAMAASLA